MNIPYKVTETVNRVIIPGIMLFSFLLGLLSVNTVAVSCKKGETVITESAGPGNPIAENIPEEESSEKLKIELEDEEVYHAVNKASLEFILLFDSNNFYYHLSLPDVHLKVQTPPPAIHT